MKRKCAGSRRFLIELGVFMVLLYGTTCSVHLNGDDFMYGTFAHDGILKNIWSYYFTGNGRLWINVLDSALLWFDRYLYLVVAPLVVLAFVWLLAKNLQMILGCADDRFKEQEFMEYGMVFFACLDVLCLRETVFWITGMMNYLFPAVMFLLGYYLFQLAQAGKLSGWKLVCYFVVSFLAASSVEQYALMFVGMMTLHHGWDLLKKKKIPGCQWTAYGIALLGLAILILAPGNSVRVDTQSELMPSFVDNFWTLIYQNTYSPVAFPLFLSLVLTINYGIKRRKHHFLNLLTIIIPVSSLVCMAIPMLKKAIILMLLLLLIFAQILYYFATVCNNRHRPVLFMLSFVGLGSQVMLLISVIWGFRCMFSLYMIYMLMTGILMHGMKPSEKAFILCSGITAALHPLITCAFWVLSALWYLLRKECLGTKCQTVLTTTCTIVALFTLCIGYGMNVPTYEENLVSTGAGNQSVVIKALPDENYSWYWVPFGDFHVDYYKQYHGLAENVEIIFDVPEQNLG